MGSFEGKVAIVTGGGSGIGLATARRLGSEGAFVVVVDLDEVSGSAAADEVDGRFVAADVAQADAWDVVLAATADGPDVVILNAGIATFSQATDDVVAFDLDRYHRIVRTNIDGVVMGTRAVVPAMRERGGGSIVVTASVAGLMGFSPDPVYTMTKHAVVGWVRSAAPALHNTKISLNAVCPGLVDTPLLGEARAMIVAAGWPLIEPEVIADAMVLAATSELSGECWVCLPGEPPRRHDFAPL